MNRTMLHRTPFPSADSTCPQLQSLYHPTRRSSDRILAMLIYRMRLVVSLSSLSSSAQPQNSLTVAGGRQGQFSSCTPLSCSHPFRDSRSSSVICRIASFLSLCFSIRFSLSSSIFLSCYDLMSHRIPRQLLQVGFRLANFRPDSMPLRITLFTTSVMFFSISFLFFGYLMVLILPICKRMMIEPNRTPFSNGFSSILSAVLLLLREKSYPSSFLIQFSAESKADGEYSTALTTLDLVWTASLMILTSLGSFSLLLWVSSWVLVRLFLRLRLVLRWWLAFRLIRSSMTAQKTSSLMLPSSTSSLSVSTFCLGIRSHSRRQSQAFLKTVREPSSQCDCLTIGAWSSLLPAKIELTSRPMMISGSCSFASMWWASHSHFLIFCISGLSFSSWQSFCLGDFLVWGSWGLDSWL